jgi:hypothetical protein
MVAKEFLLNKLKVFKVWLVLIFLGFFLASCLPKTGHISWQATDDVEVDLANGFLHPGFNYYYCGPEAIPHTIIGLYKDVPFQQNFWQPAQYGQTQVKEWLQAIDNPHRPVNDMYFGGRLLDRKGNFLGIWYSKHHFYSGYLDGEGRLVVLRPVERAKRNFMGFIFS